MLRQIVLKLVLVCLRWLRIPDVRLLPGDTIITLGDSIIVEGVLTKIAQHSKLALSQDSASDLNWHPIGHPKIGMNGGRYFTLNFFYWRGPIYQNLTFRYPLIERLGLLFLSFLVRVRIEPANHLQAQIAQNKQLTPDRMLRLTKLDFYTALKSIRGRPFQSWATQERLILSGREFDEDLAALADRTGRTTDTLRKEATTMLRSMAARPIKWLYVVVEQVIGFCFRRLFSEIDVVNLEHFRKVAGHDSVVLVPTHRSHLDYLILSYVLYRSNLNPPLVAAGENLNFWPVGWLMRSVGAYFIRREPRRDRLYYLVLKRYVSYLAKRGHLQEFFIEGGRSRSGHLLPPKYGLLKLIVDNFVATNNKDVLFVPVSISYERVVEDSILAQENTGAGKVKESFASLLRAGSLFKTKYGAVNVDFGEVISLRQFVTNQTAPKSRSTTSNFALTLVSKIRQQTRVGLGNMIYSALMLTPGYSLPISELPLFITNLSHLAKIHAKATGYEMLLTTPLKKFIDEGTATPLAGEALIDFTEFGDSHLLTIPGDKRFRADFYKNTIAHLFHDIALLQLTKLMKKELTWCLDNIKLFENNSIHDRANSEWWQQLQTLISDSTHEWRGLFIPQLLLPIIEAQLWIYHLLKKTSLTQADLIQKLQDNIKIGARLRILTRTESQSRAIHANAIEILLGRKALDITDDNLSINNDNFLYETLCEIQNALVIWLHEVNKTILAKT